MNATVRGPSSGRSSPRIHRIAFVSNSARGEFTGRFRWVEPLRREGFEVVFVLPTGEDDHLAAMQDRGVECHAWRLHRSSVHPQRVSRSIESLVGALEASRCDAIHGFGHAANILSALALPRVVPRLLFHHVTGLGSVFTDPSPTLRDHFLRWAILRTYRMLGGRVAATFFQNAQDEIAFSFVPAERRVRTAGTGVEPSAFDPATMRPELLARLREELRLEPGRIVVGFVGRLLAHKGVRELLGAMDLLATASVPVTLLVIGPLDPANTSALGEELLGRYEDREDVRLLGRREDVAELLAVTDIFVNPSYREGLPRTQLEAMAMETPVIACDVPGSRDTVLDGVSGLLVPARDERALSAAIHQLATDPGRRHSMGRAGRELVLKKFSVDACVRPVVARYRSLLGVADGGEGR